MKTCEEFQELAIFNDGLSAVERQEIDQHVAECADCRQRLHDVQAIMAGLRQLSHGEHCDDEQLTRYGIYLSDPHEPDYDGRRLAPAEIAVIRRHTAKCQTCQQKVERVVQEFREMESYLAEAGVPTLTIGKVSFGAVVRQKIANLAEGFSSFIKSAGLLPGPKLYPAVAFAAVLLLLWLSPLFRGEGYKYDQLAALEAEQVGWLSREANAKDLSEGLYAFDQQQYEQAVEKLEQVISDNPEPRVLAQAHYVAGVACLFRAKSDFLGRFQKYDEALLAAGLAHLQAAVARSDNLRLTEEAHWFLGKAHLMKHQAEEALADFDKVVALQGARKAAAQNLIAEIKHLPRVAP